MGASPRVIAVIPAFNEGRNIPIVIDNIRQNCPTWDIVVVDDGSVDETSKAAERLGVLVLRLVTNLGIGGAVQTGIMYACRQGYDVCLQIDGDGQHDSRESVHLVETLTTTQADAVIGSRFLGKGGYQSNLPRRMGILILRWVLQTLTGQVATDPTSGQRALGRRAIELLAKEYPQQYPEPEAIYLMQRHGLRLVEVPVQMHQRANGRSSIRPIHSVMYMLKVTIGILVQAMTKHEESCR